MLLLALEAEVEPIFAKRSLSDTALLPGAAGGGDRTEGIGECAAGGGGWRWVVYEVPANG